MKTRIALFLLMVFLLSGAGALAQEKSVITVKGSSLSNGVVIVDVLKGAKGYYLECNKGAPSCTDLKSGKYQMVELPSNMGMYECRDVLVFPETADTSDTDKKIGEYCLTDK